MTLSKNIKLFLREELAKTTGGSTRWLKNRINRYGFDRKGNKAKIDFDKQEIIFER